MINDQYVECLNAVAQTDVHVLYNGFMGSEVRGGITPSGLSGNFSCSVKLNMGNKPAKYMSFLDAMRFANWLESGQSTGVSAPTSTEDSIYTIGTGLDKMRALGATFFLPSENEWYKAARHQLVSQGETMTNIGCILRRVTSTRSSLRLTTPLVRHEAISRILVPMWPISVSAPMGMVKMATSRRLARPAPTAQATTEHSTRVVTSLNGTKPSIS